MSLENLTPSEFARWFQLGQSVRRMMGKEPVAYLYGADKLRLPDIYKMYTPELQKTHPYAFINKYVRVGFETKYRLYICKNKPTTRFNGVFINGDYKRAECYYGDSTWGEFADYSTTGTAIGIVYWTNHDLIFVDDGSLYLAATDPIPVYE